MVGLKDLIVAATWPDDTPSRREARGILYVIAFVWLGLITTPFLIALAYGGK